MGLFRTNWAKWWLSLTKSKQLLELETLAKAAGETAIWKELGYETFQRSLNQFVVDKVTQTYQTRPDNKYVNPGEMIATYSQVVTRPDLYPDDALIRFHFLHDYWHDQNAYNLIVQRLRLHLLKLADEGKGELLTKGGD